MARCLTFDAAGTLVDVAWDPARLAVSHAGRLGIEVESVAGIDRYRSILARRWPEFREINLSRCQEEADRFWVATAAEWLTALGEDPAHAEPLTKSVMQEIFAPGSPAFRLFPDTMPALEALQAAGWRMAILSNWDLSLHRVVELLGLAPYFEVVVASLEEGVEKPDPEIFRLTLARMGVRPAEAIHIGDDPIDDIQGARSFGMRAIRIDRTLDRSEGWAVARLTDLSTCPEAMDLL